MDQNNEPERKNEMREFDQAHILLYENLCELFERRLYLNSRRQQPDNLDATIFGNGPRDRMQVGSRIDQQEVVIDLFFIEERFIASDSSHHNSSPYTVLGTSSITHLGNSFMHDNDLAEIARLLPSDSPDRSADNSDYVFIAARDRSALMVPFALLAWAHRELTVDDSYETQSTTDYDALQYLIHAGYEPYYLTTDDCNELTKAVYSTS